MLLRKIHEVTTQLPDLFELSLYPLILDFHLKLKKMHLFTSSSLTLPSNFCYFPNIQSRLLVIDLII